LDGTPSFESIENNQAQEGQKLLLPDNRRAVTRPPGGRSSKRSTSHKDNRIRLYLGISIPVLTIVMIGAYVLIWFVNNGNPAFQPTSADQNMVQQVIGVDPSTWESIGTGGTSNPWTYTRGQPALFGPNGHPEFFFVGYEWCPFCATESWAILNALSRFGTFSNLSQYRTYEGNIASIGFYQSIYTSRFVDFVPVELEGNVHNIWGQWVTVQSVRPDQEQLYNRYNSSKYLPYSNALPFIDLDNQYLLQGGFNPAILQNASHQSLSYEEIASSLTTISSPIARNILGTANYLTAGICTVTDQQPESVCHTSTIQETERLLG
jgi:Domain of unknown function (DUF929)